MRCPRCTTDDTRVIDSRPAESGASVRRRRLCQACDHRFTTFERHVPVLVVRKRNGVTEPFDPRKVRRGVESALADRPVPDDTIDRIVGRAETLVEQSSTPVGTDEIGRVVLDELRLTDEVAYLRFASVYKEFQGAADFEREVAALEEVGD